jgi:hypothetical protein
MTIYEQIQKIRSFVSPYAMQQILKKDGVLWYQMCSCLDVIEDTELAITAYIKREYKENTEGHYLAVYGLLQAFFAQQDAAINLCESIGISKKINNYPILEKIRRIRNDTVGHATKRGSKNKTSYHFISQITLKHEGFQHLSIDSSGKVDFEDVSIPDLISDQRTYLSHILSSTIVKLEHMGKTLSHK